MAQKKDIQIFLGVQVNNKKYVVDKRFSFEQYQNAKNPKAYLREALAYCNISLRDLLKENDQI